MKQNQHGEKYSAMETELEKVCLMDKIIPVTDKTMELEAMRR